MLGTISDIAGILSFIMSIILFCISHSILKYSKQQRKDYNSERHSIQSDLIALRDNIVEDNLYNKKIRSHLRQTIYSYRIKYWFISFPFCLYHIQLSLFLLKETLDDKHTEMLCKHIDYLIANMDKKEYIENE